MGLLTIIRKQKLKDREIRVLMLGLDNAGKTTIVKALLGEDVTTISPTLGFNIRTIKHKQFKVNIWDVGGQRTLRPFWRNYYEQTDSLIWVVDATALDRLEDCRVELHKVLTEDRLAGASLLILVNKMDAVGESPEEQSKVIDRVQTALQLDEISGNKHKTQVLGCSAYKGTNLENAIDWVVNEVKSRMFQTVDDD